MSDNYFLIMKGMSFVIGLLCGWSIKSVCSRRNSKVEKKHVCQCNGSPCALSQNKKQ